MELALVLLLKEEETEEEEELLLAPNDAPGPICAGLVVAGCSPFGCLGTIEGGADIGPADAGSHGMARPEPNMAGGVGGGGVRGRREGDIAGRE